MSSFSELLWALNAKEFKVYSSSEGSKDKKRYVHFSVKSKDVKGWMNLIDRFNSVYDSPFIISKLQSEQKLPKQLEQDILIEFNTNINNYEKLEKDISILTYAVIKDEFIYPEYKNVGTTLDIKLGLSCNNNCVHCVVKPNIYNIQKQSPESIVVNSSFGIQSSCDLTYTQIINTIMSQKSKIKSIVLTGGEPTIRKDFIQILKWLYYNAPEIQVCIQTNGRNLADRDLVMQMKRYLRRVNIAVAIHGNENIHNTIVNNRKETGNPFLESVEGIKNLLNYFPNDINNIRSEMVLSNYNIEGVFESVKFQIEQLGLKTIGISYPHLDGFEKDKIVELAPNINDVFSIMKKLNEYVMELKDVRIFIEEVPPCIYSKLDKAIRLNTFPFHRQDIAMNFLGNQTSDFCSCWENDHAKFIKCKDCILDKKCIGVWKETKDLIEPHIEPITEITSHMKRFLEKCNLSPSGRLMRNGEHSHVKEGVQYGTNKKRNFKDITRRTN